MSQSDRLFSGSIAALYDDLMGPVFFAPFAQDLARRAATLKPHFILETAAGSGISTLALVAALPNSEIAATDLNQDMINVAKSKPALAQVKWQAADATKLAYADQIFDLVVSQFGVMFFPDKPAAFREALRVLKPGGNFIFSVWDSLDANPVPEAVLWALERKFPENSPSFMRRIPHGFYDVPELSRALLEAGFHKASAEHVELPCEAPSARHLAVALCQGTPMRAEIEAFGNGSLQAATDFVENHLVKKFGDGPVNSTMQAIVFTAHS